MPGTDPQIPDSSTVHCFFPRDPAPLILEPWHTSGILCPWKSLKTTFLLHFHEVLGALVAQGQNPLSGPTRGRKSQISLSGRESF